MSDPSNIDDYWTHIAKVIEQLWSQLTLEEKLNILQEAGFEFDED